MMKVELVDYQKNALDLLLYTKNTRLQGADTLEDIAMQTIEWKLDQLAYMKDTIKSSWEFADYTFQISGVSRAFTHQLVRTRTASFAQEAQRVVDMSEVDFILPDTIDGNGNASHAYAYAIVNQQKSYQNLIELGIPRQDARNIIGTGCLTSIMMKANLRTLHNMAELRLCFRVQSEFQNVFAEMKKRVVEVHPWAEEFIQVYCVNHGTCAFPRYTECPIQHLTIQGETLKIIKMHLKEEHAKTKHEANPVINAEGKTM
jgi:flavin-dependent thymidylate synthase